MPLHIPTLGERVTEADIWAYPTRELTTYGVAWEVEAEGILTADGTEQTIVDVQKTEPFKSLMYIDMSNLVGADQVDIVEYMQTSATESLKSFTRSRFVGVQNPPMMMITEKLAAFRHVITLEQFGGAYRDFPWQLLVEVLT